MISTDSDPKEVLISNKQSRLTGQKPPLKLREIWAIRTRLELAKNIRELALFNLAIDSKLRACDLLRMKVSDVATGVRILSRSSIIQKKTGQPVKFEITPLTQESLKSLIEKDQLVPDDHLFKSRLHDSTHLSRRQY
jgi:integrase